MRFWGGSHACESTWPFLKEDGLIRAVLGLLEVVGRRQEQASTELLESLVTDG